MQSRNKIHFISIGGSVMHDLAINLKKSGNEVTGSDDKIYEPSKTNLKKIIFIQKNFDILKKIFKKILIL